MTFIVSLLCERPKAKPILNTHHLEVEEAVQNQDAWARAGYLKGLARYLMDPVEGIVYYVLKADTDIYKSSNAFFSYSASDDDPAFLNFEEPFRAEFDRLLATFTRSSSVGRVIVVAEYNGGVTAPDLDEASVDMVDVLGPMSISEFWLKHDLGEIFEDSLVVIQESSNS